MDSVMKVLAGIIGVCSVLALTVAINGWIVMLLWGAIAPHFGVSTIGFGLSMLIGVALAVIGGFFKPTTRR